MSNQDLVLNIATNMGRLGRWACEGNTARISQFLPDTQKYIDQLRQPNPRFQSINDLFLKDFSYLKSQNPDSKNWADTAFTWAAILTHRSQLA